MATELKIELGREYQDKITGFRGTCTGIVFYISGCNQALVAPKVDKDGKARESAWFDVQRLEAVKSKQIKLDNGDCPGFDKPAPMR